MLQKKLFTKIYLGLLALFACATLSAQVATDAPALLKTFNNDQGVLAVEVSLDNRLLISGGASRDVIIWNIITGQKQLTLKGHTDDVVAVRFDPSGRLAASSSVDKTIIIWDISSGQLVHRITGHADYVRDICFSPDGKLLCSASWDQTAIIWDVTTGRQLQTFTGHRDNVTSACFSPDGTQVVTACGDHNLRIWDASNGRLVKTIQGHTDEIWDVKWSKNPRLIASGAWDNTARFWDVETGKEIYTFPGHTTDVWAVSFSPDNQLLASCGGDRKVKVWDLAMGEILCDLSGNTHTADVEEVAYSADGNMIVSTGLDGSIRVWSAPSLEYRVRIFTEKRMERWTQRDPYEKTDAYTKRMEKRAKQTKIEEEVVLEKMKAGYVNNLMWKKSFSLKDYDADNEQFMIKSSVFGDMFLKVPIDEAKGFEQNFALVEFTDLELGYEQNKMKIKQVSANVKGDKKKYKTILQSYYQAK